MKYCKWKGKGRDEIITKKILKQRREQKEKKNL